MTKLIYILFLILFFFAAKQPLFAAPEEYGHENLIVDSLQQKEWPYVVVVSKGVKPTVLPDSIFYDIAKGVIFPVNQYTLANDDAWLTELRQKLKPWAEKNRLRLKYLMLRGASSPEGPTKRNDFLAEARTKALQDKLESIFDVSRITLLVDGHAEDWNSLVFLMEQANDPDLPTIRRILSENAGNRELIKQVMKAADGGNLWNRIFDKYFSLLRYARVVLFFELKDLRAPSMRMPLVTYTAEKPDFGFDSIHISYVQPVEAVKVPARYPRHHVLGIRTNMLYDAFWMPRYGMAPTPNLSLEFYPKIGHFTYNITGTLADWERWNDHKYWQIQDVNAGVRFYTRSRKKAPRDVADNPLAPVAADRFLGFYIGMYGHINRFGIGLDKDTGWQGEGWGAGLQIGYTLPLCKSYRWRMEFSIGAGYYTCKYDPYVWGNPVNGKYDGLYYYDYHGPASKFIERNHRFRWIGPTEIGIHLTYDLLYRRGYGKKGVSFRRWKKQN